MKFELFPFADLTVKIKYLRGASLYFEIFGLRTNTLIFFCLMLNLKYECQLVFKLLF